MRPRKLILGSGVAAGLAANLLGDSHDVCIAWLRNAATSPIPELLPRRAFFDALGVTKAEETLAIAEVTPRLKAVTWDNGGISISRSLESTDAFLVYEKGRLAAWLRKRAMAAGTQTVMLDTTSKIMDFGGYDFVLDCRGSRSVAEDLGYEVTQEAQARTCCTYAILNRPESVAADQMVFWSVLNEDRVQRTLFCVPVGEESISVGCSYSPTIRMNVNDVLEAACDFGLSLSTQHIQFTGEAAPHLVTAKALDPRVTPVGDASRSSCPLTEYGTMAALSQLLRLRGEPDLPLSVLMRPTHCQIDPHIPLELFS